MEFSKNNIQLNFEVLAVKKGQTYLNNPVPKS